jgi:hypothetical protein
MRRIIGLHAAEYAIAIRPYGSMGIEQIAFHDCKNSSSVILNLSSITNSILPFNNPNGLFLTVLLFKDRTKFNVQRFFDFV